MSGFDAAAHAVAADPYRDLIGATMLDDQAPELPGEQVTAGDDDTLAAFPRLDLTALVRGDRPPRDWVVDGLVPAGAAVSVVAAGGVGKSLLCLALALAVVRGEPFAGLTVPRRRRVLYIDAENSLDDLAERLTDLGVSPDAGAQLDDLIMLHLPDLPPLDHAAGGATLLAIVEAYALDPGDLVVLDSQQRVTVGPENDSDTQRAYYRHSGQPLKKLGLTVLRTDNTGKDAERGARGTSGKRDDVDVEWMLSRLVSDGSRLALRQGKARLPDLADLTLSRDVDDEGRLSFSSHGDPFRVLVAECAATLDRLGVAWDAGEPTAMKALKDAPSRGRVSYPRAVVRAAVKRRKTSPRVLGEVLGEHAPQDLAGPERRAVASPATDTTEPLLSPGFDLAAAGRRGNGEDAPAAPSPTSPPSPPYRGRRGGEQNPDRHHNGDGPGGVCSCGEPHTTAIESKILGGLVCSRCGNPVPAVHA